MESNVSDDESDTTSLDDLVELVHEQKGMLKKQANEIKELNDLSATLATNYEHLLCKFKLLIVGDSPKGPLKKPGESYLKPAKKRNETPLT
jgi:bifunctional ADP-heptose synthase (sugar kinase/adenylyltransferase)